MYIVNTAYILLALFLTGKPRGLSTYDEEVELDQVSCTVPRRLVWITTLQEVVGVGHGLGHDGCRSRLLIVFVFIFHDKIGKTRKSRVRIVTLASYLGRDVGTRSNVGNPPVKWGFSLLNAF